MRAFIIIQKNISQQKTFPAANQKVYIKMSEQNQTIVKTINGTTDPTCS